MDKYLKRLMKKVNPMAKILMNSTFRQQILVNKKLYDRKKIKVIKILEDNKITNVGKNTPYKNDEEDNV